MPLRTPMHYQPKTILSRVTSWASIAIVGLISKIWLEWLNKFHCHNRKGLYDVLYRAKNTPLITVANHVSCLDDPCLWGLLPLRFLIGPSNIHHLRWALGASDICFTTNLHSRFFLSGKTVPCVRGEGVYQKVMDFVINRLNKADWVHVFPEGRINMGNEYIRLKWGVGRMINECALNPIVLPMWHCGMQEVLPNKLPYRPQIGKYVTMYVGKPMDFTNQLKSLREAKKSSQEIRKAITDVIEAELVIIKARAEELHARHIAGLVKNTDS